MARPACVGERFPAFNLHVRPFLPPLEGALAVVCRLLSFGSFRCDTAVEGGSSKGALFIEGDERPGAHLYRGAYCQVPRHFPEKIHRRLIVEQMPDRRVWVQLEVR